MSYDRNLHDELTKNLPSRLLENYSNQLKKQLESSNDLISEARKELSAIKAAIELTKCNEWGCEIRIGGVIVGVSKNEIIASVLQMEAQEIEKFLKGEPNTWE